jgi:hypothetical protein
LARLLHRVESDPPYLLTAAARKSPGALFFRPAREKAAWKKLIRELA